MRSLLFVPADSARKFARALGSGADALLIDLEDSVTPDAKFQARELARGFLDGPRANRPSLLVRINSLESGLADLDLAAVIPARPDGILLPKCSSGRDVQHLSAKLAVHEAESGFADAATPILAIATETASSIFQLGTYAGASHRLGALTWGAEDLSADLCAEASRDAHGHLTGPYQLVRSLVLLGAAAAGVAAIDTVFTDFRDGEGLLRECEAARRDGFSGKMAIHPDQVAIINAAFTPTPDRIAEAQRLVDAFAASPQSGVVALDGRMYDRPHLKRAQKLLARSAGAGEDIERAR